MKNKLYQPARAAKPDANTSKGFTIIELLIATSVFSLVLLVALGAFLQIGRLFYKGVSLTGLQNVATQAMNDISSNMQTSDTFSPVTSTGTNGYTYFCVGNTRYTYTMHTAPGGQHVSNIANSAVSPTNYSSGANGSFGLLKDTLPGNSGCASPVSTPLSSSATEMLGDQMRLASITITQSSGNLYNIKMVVAYGTDQVLDFTTPAAPACTGSSANQAFCSVVTVQTAVFMGSQT